MNLTLLVDLVFVVGFSYIAINFVLGLIDLWNSIEVVKVEVSKVDEVSEVNEISLTSEISEVNEISEARTEELERLELAEFDGKLARIDFEELLEIKSVREVSYESCDIEQLKFLGKLYGVKGASLWKKQATAVSRLRELQTV